MSEDFNIKSLSLVELEALRSFATLQYEAFMDSQHQQNDDEGYNENSYYYKALQYYQWVMETTENELHLRVIKLFDGFPEITDFDL